MSDASPTAAALPASAVLGFAAIAAAACLNAVSGALVVTAYPVFAEAFDLPYAHVSRLVMFFLAATAAVQPIAGGLGDLFGRKRIFLIGIVGFSVSSVVAGFTDSFDGLVFWRVTQALFSGTITAIAPSLVHRVVPEARLGSYLGMLHAAIVGCSAMAFPLGGFIIKAFSWPVLFWCSVPVGILGLALTLRFVPDDREEPTRLSSLGLVGLPFIPLAMSLQAVVQREPVLPGLLFLAVTVAAVYFAILRSPGSRTHFSSINNIAFNLSGAVAVFSSGVNFSLIFMLPIWGLVSLHVSPLELGFYIGCFTLSMMCTSPVFGRYVDQKGTALPIALSALLVATGFGLLIFLLGKATFVAAMLSIGSGIAIAQLISQRAALLSSPLHVQALAMGMFSTARSAGCVLGNALSAIVFSLHPTVTTAVGTSILVCIYLMLALPLAAGLWLLGQKFRA